MKNWIKRNLPKRRKMKMTYEVPGGVIALHAQPSVDLILSMLTMMNVSFEEMKATPYYQQKMDLAREAIEAEEDMPEINSRNSVFFMRRNRDGMLYDYAGELPDVVHDYLDEHILPILSHQNIYVTLEDGVEVDEHMFLPIRDDAQLIASRLADDAFSKYVIPLRKK